MKLKSISVTNFRVLRGSETTLTFDGSEIIFLLGQNNTGKSAVLDAYSYLVAPKQKALLSDFHGFDTKNPIVIQATFMKEEGDADIFVKKGLDKWVDTNGLLHFEKVWTDTTSIGQKRTRDPATGEYEDNGFGGLETHLTKHAPTPIRIPAMPSTAELDKWVNETFKKVVLATLDDEEAQAYQEAANSVNTLRDKLFSNQKLADLSTKANFSFQEVFPDLHLGLRAEEGADFDIGKLFDKKVSVTIRDPLFENLDQGYQRHGDGVIRQAMFNFLGIVKNELALGAEGEKGEASRKQFIVLFEEPEVYLHPRAVHRLRRLLYDLCTDSSFQFLCASHSPSLINLARPQTSLVRIVRCDEGTTAFHQVGKSVFAASEEKKKRVQMVNRFNPYICESFFADRVLIVEGDTEAIVARELLGRLDSNHDLFVLNAGSKMNIPFFQEIFRHFQIVHFIVHDADCRYQYSKDGVRKIKSNGSARANAAWTLNATIASEMDETLAVDPNLTRRYVCLNDFESAHGYTHDLKMGKPLSAFEYAQTIDIDSDLPIVRFLRDALGQSIQLPEFSQAYLEANVIEPDGGNV